MKKYLPLFAILLIAFIAIVYLNSNLYKTKKTTQRLLPILGNKVFEFGDTLYHTVSNFSFTNQLGQTITLEDVKNKNFVAEYFFVNCEGICPIMNKNMMKVAKAFENDTNLKILSHTVKPEEDSVSNLLAYAQRHNANAKNWWFLTGNKKALYRMARKSYLMNNEEGDGDKDDFIHTELFVLVDKEKHIRGFYDGTSDADVSKLITDINRLRQEQLNDTN